jgi:MFS family permease
MSQLDASIVSVALPRIGSDLHAGASIVQWVSLSYMLTLLAALVAVGRVSDLVGRKLLYTHGFAVFMLGSALCGLAPTLGWLIAARVLQGFGAAMLQANSVALIRQAMPPGELAHAIGIQGAAQAIGLAAGPALGGLLLALGGWRLIFLVNLPFGLLGLALGRLLLPRSHNVTQVKADGRGTVSIAALLRAPAVSFGLLGGFLSYMATFGALFVIPYYLIAARVSSALAGVELACLPISLGLVALLASRAYTHLPTRLLKVGGLAMAGAGILELALAHDGAGRLIGLAVAGAGLGVFTPVNNASVMRCAPRAYAGVLGGLLNMTRTLGAIAGVALASLLYSHAAGTGSSRAGAGLTLSLLVLAALTLLGSLAMLAEPAARADRSHTEGEFTAASAGSTDQSSDARPRSSGAELPA